MELGIYTFVENTHDANGKKLSPEQRIQNLLEKIRLV